MNKSIKKVLATLGKITLVIFLAYLALFCLVVVHEFIGHIAADALVFARHGSNLARSEVIVQFLSITQQGVSWSLGLAPFRIGGKVVYAVPSDPITLTNWDIGFGNFMGSGITILFSLIALSVLNLRKDLPHFPWFAGFFSLYSVVFDQILYTFGNPADALDGAVLMGADPLLFKIFIIFLVLLQAFLVVRIAIRYWRGRQAHPMVNE